MAEKKIFVGSGKKKHEQWLKCNISEKGLQTLLENLQEFNGNRFAKVDINILTKPNQWGKDVEIVLDTWKPDGNRTVRDEIKEVSKSVEQNSDMPF